MSEEPWKQDFAKYVEDHPEEWERFAQSVRTLVRNVHKVDLSLKDSTNRLATATAAWREEIHEATRGLMPALAKLGALSDKSFPSNLPRRPTPTAEELTEVLEVDGIPIIHIPRAEIVRAIIDADAFDARLAVIDTHRDDIIDDCAKALDREVAKALEKQVPLARRALVAFQDGHCEAAQALAVTVCDTYLKSLFIKTAYKKMAESVSLSEHKEAPADVAFNVFFALAPVASFLTEWRPNGETEPPTKLSRHVSIHFASTDQMTRTNSVLALMLCTSMTIAIDWSERYIAERA